MALLQPERIPCFLPSGVTCLPQLAWTFPALVFGGGVPGLGTPSFPGKLGGSAFGLHHSSSLHLNTWMLIYGFLSKRVLWPWQWVGLAALCESNTLSLLCSHHSCHDGSALITGWTSCDRSDGGRCLPVSVHHSSDVFSVCVMDPTRCCVSYKSGQLCSVYVSVLKILSNVREPDTAWKWNPVRWSIPSCTSQHLGS